MVKRIFVYLAGMIILSFGIVLNTKVELGVSPVITVSYTISKIWSLDFSLITFLLYSLFCMVEVIIRGFQNRWKEVPLILLQLPLSFVFTRAMYLYDRWIPAASLYAGTFYGTVFFRTVILFVAILCMGIGVVLTVEPHLVPNPTDGMTDVIADAVGMNMGTVKNILDITCVGTACLICVLCHHRITGVGIGTILSMLLIGRVVAFTNQYVKARLV